MSLTVTFDPKCREAFVKIIKDENFYVPDWSRESLKAHWRGPEYGFAKESLQREWRRFSEGWQCHKAEESK